MNIWRCNNWKVYYNDVNNLHRKGLRFKFDSGISSDVKSVCKDFGKWLRQEFVFPIRLPIYVKNTETIIAKDGESVYGTFSFSDNREFEPYIRIAVGDYQIEQEKIGRSRAMTTILLQIAHEITHYYQWINGYDLSEGKAETQAVKYSLKIKNEYAMTREQP